ncbi:MAG: Ig-like domain-containing protein [Coriobacteriia bacterium]|nr:Ig-like domain-containing protein [Coriobacteriia bacterium]
MGTKRNRNTDARAALAPVLLAVVLLMSAWIAAPALAAPISAGHDAEGSAGQGASGQEGADQPPFAPVIAFDYGPDDPEPSNGSYYAAARSATVEVAADGFDAGRARIQTTGSVQAGADGSVWERRGSSFFATVAFSGDGRHSLRVSARDAAGHEVFKMDSFVIDATAPEMTVAFGDDARAGTYHDRERTAVVTVRDANFDERLVRVSDAGDEGSVSDIRWAAGEGDEHTGTLTFRNSAAAHRLVVEAADLAGNRARVLDGQGGESTRYDSGAFYVDTVDPSVEITQDKSAVNVHEGVEYFNEGVTVSVAIVDDHLDPERSRLELTGSCSQTEWERDGADARRWVKKVSFAEGAGNRVGVVAVDKAGRTARSGCSYGPFTVDATAPEVTGARMSSDPARSYEDGFWFYARPAALSVDVSDEAGLWSVDVVDAGDGFYSRSVLSPADAVAGRARRTATVELAEGRAIDRDVYIRVVDLAKNERLWSLSPRGTARVVSEAEVENASILPAQKAHPEALLLDASAPAVELSGADEGAYYNAARTVSLSVDELNLPFLLGHDPGQAVLSVQRLAGDSGGAASSWSRPARELSVTGLDALTFTDSRGGRVAYSRYGLTETLAEDGHYAVEARVADPAGNVGAARIGEFTIDATPPTVQVSFDNEDVRNGKYYRAPRTATVRVVEHNFDAGLMEVETNGAVGTWSDDGDVHALEVAFAADGAYRLRVAGKDKAGNALEPYQADEFVVDLTPPTVAISGVEDSCAYNGEAAPRIDFADEANFDADGASWQVVGSRNGEVSWPGEVASEGSSGTARLVDLAHEEASDDIYTLTAHAVDLAGNEAEAEVTFSVNRFGSTFRVADADALAENGGYLSEPRPVVFEEINVSGAGTEARAVVVTCGAQVHELLRTEGPGPTGYTIEEGVSGDDATRGWSVCRYTVAAGNFARDGRYHVSVRSRDRAGNVNSSSDFFDRGQGTGSSAEAEFVIDTVGPSILGLSIGDGDVIEASECRGTFKVVDNIGVRSVEVFVDGREAEAVDDGYGNYAFSIEAKPRAERELAVVAIDLAGHVTRAEAKGFRVTTDVLELHFGQVIGIAVAAAALLAALLALDRRRRREARVSDPRGRP